MQLMKVLELDLFVMTGKALRQEEGQCCFITYRTFLVRTAAILNHTGMHEGAAIPGKIN